jgi:hypothetical protein
MQLGGVGEDDVGERQIRKRVAGDVVHEDEQQPEPAEEIEAKIA